MVGESTGALRPTGGRMGVDGSGTDTHTRTQPFNGPSSGTTQVSRYQKGKTNLDFTEARDSEWQWHQLSHMQVCTTLQTDNHASTPPLSFFTGRMPILPPNQQRQSSAGSGTDTRKHISRHVSFTRICDCRIFHIAAFFAYFSKVPISAILIILIFFVFLFKSIFHYGDCA